MIKIAVITLGCPKNTADTESVLAELPRDYQIANLSEAEMVILNTCAFLKSSRDETYGILEELGSKKVILIGCLATQLKQDFFRKYPQVSAIVSPVCYPQIAEVISAVAKGETVYAVSAEPKEYVDMEGKFLITPPSYAYIKIAEGCNNACAFCLIPHLRGAYRSRPMPSILSEAEELVKSGIKELVLVAQDTGMYGADIYKKKALPELLRKLTAIKGDFWIRVMYLYPERITDELLSVIAGSDKICKYLDIPLQHGDPEILKAMRRPYDIPHTLKKIAAIRKAVPGVTLRTSLITGFPGETEKQFKNLISFLEEISFDHAGVFEYSREKGTDAYNLKNQLPTATKKKRRNKTMQRQQKISLAKNKALIGKTVKTLIEEYDEAQSLYIGRPQRFAPEVDGQALIRSKKPLPLNQFAEVRIAGASEYDLTGVVKK